MKQLYEVERTFYVMAEDESDAETFQPNDAQECTNEVSLATTVDAGWWDAIPFNSDDDRTCGEILKGQRQLAGL